jgi:hypothetical protein
VRWMAYVRGSDSNLRRYEGGKVLQFHSGRSRSRGWERGGKEGI